MPSLSEARGRDIELRLHGYRGNQHLGYPIAGGGSKTSGGRWGPADLEALLWIEGLAQAGHWGARLLLRRIADTGEVMQQLASIDPEVTTRLAKLSPRGAFVAALTEAHRAAPDFTRLGTWLAMSGDAGNALAQCLAEARRLIGALQEPDLETLRDGLATRSQAEHVLARFGMWRLESTEPATASLAGALLEAAAKRGSRLALRTLFDREWSRAADKIALAESWCAKYAEHVPAREVRAALKIAGTLSDGELDLLQTTLGEGLDTDGMLLLEMARKRHQSGADPATTGALVQAATEVAGRPELATLWKTLWSASANRRATLDGWFERFADLQPGARQAFEAGAWIERNHLEGGAEPLLAALWYARARDVEMPAGGPIPASICYYVAVHLNPHGRYCWVDAPDLALSWYERGIRLGDEKCLDDWLIYCARGVLVNAAGPEEAVERVRRCAAAKGAAQDPLGGLTGGIKAICMRGEGHMTGDGVAKAPALARRWLQVGVEARYAPAMKRLAEIGT